MIQLQQVKQFAKNLFQKINKTSVITLLIGGSFSATALAGTIDDIKKNGFLKCGVNNGLPGFSNPNDKGQWSGMDVDVCRAVAAAIFGDSSKVKYTPLSAKERFTALQSGEIDILSRNTTWTLTRDASLGLNFTGVIYHDGQGFMVRKNSGVKSAKELDGATVCLNTGTTTELNVADFFRANKLKYEVLAFEKADEAVAAYDNNRCDTYTTDASGLAAQRVKLKDPSAHEILPELISKEPLGPLVRQGDDKFANLVRWTLFALVNAEEMGITQANVEQMKKSDNPSIKRLLGAEGAYGEMMGVSNDWAYNIVKAVGNYGEIFERNLGPKTPINLPRGVNNLWSNGGIQFAPPVR